jgi:hypothetical protein
MKATVSGRRSGAPAIPASRGRVRPADPARALPDALIANLHHRQAKLPTHARGTIGTGHSPTQFAIACSMATSEPIRDMECQQRVADADRDQDNWTRKSMLNSARGRFLIGSLDP